MRVAITHDWLNQHRGGERVLREIHALFPDAPVFTTVHDPRRLPEEMRAWDIRPSFLQRIPLARRYHQVLLPLMPLAFEQIDLNGYDLVVSSSSACAKGVIVPPGGLHVCYCHTPMRYVWDLYHEYAQGAVKRALIGPVAHWLRQWDQLSAARVDHFIANSEWVASRIRTYYRREAEVIYPPVDVERITPNGRDPEDFYLVVSALVGYKRIDLAVEAASRLGRRLIVVGEGPQRKRLQAMAGPTVEFRGWLDSETVFDLMARCRAFLFPGCEDFGIAPVEVQAAGRPVIAYGRGGACETVLDGQTGLLFAEQTVEALSGAILALERAGIEPAACRANAQRFSAANFRTRLRQSVETRLQGAQAPHASIRLVAP